MSDLLIKITESLEAEFKKYNRYYDVYNDYCGLCIEVNWGDWKHDHLFVKWTVDEVLEKMGFKGKYTVTEQVTEEDGSDTYSAIHVIKFRWG